MKPNYFSVLALQFLLLLVSAVSSQDYDFFYFVLQWPGAVVDTDIATCYPIIGKPAPDFGIHGLWPRYNDGTAPSNCHSNTPFDPSQVSDLLPKMRKNWPSYTCPASDDTSFWTDEWVRHGTCSESVLNQHSYFHAALALKNKVNLLKVLDNSGIAPYGAMYSVQDIKDVIIREIGFEPFIDCNHDAIESKTQLYQIFFCAEKFGYNLIECPIFPPPTCPTDIEFPVY